LIAMAQLLQAEFNFQVDKTVEIVKRNYFTQQGEFKISHS